MSEDLSRRVRQLENDLATTQQALAMMIEACGRLTDSHLKLRSFVDQIALVTATYMSMDLVQQAEFRGRVPGFADLARKAAGPAEPTDTQLAGTKSDAEAIMRAIMATEAKPPKKGDVH